VKRIVPILSAIGLRYSALIIQFALVILISRGTTTQVAGGYFIVFGLINSTYFMAGLGIPDGMVREVSHHIGLNERSRVYPLAARCGQLAALLILAMAGAGIVVAMAAGVERTLVLLSAVWWLCYATVFFCAQAHLALERPTLGSFFFYPALNISLLFTLFPFLLTTHQPSLNQLIAAAVCGAAPMTVVAVVITVLAARPFRAGADRTAPVDIGRVVGLGIRIAMARVAQTAIYWLPTWVAGAALSPSQAAILGLGSRLNNAVAAVMAAIRFIVRPQIVAAAARDDWVAISLNARSINTLTAAGALVAIVGYLLLGRPLIVAVFGMAYVAVFWPLLVMLFGTLAEATGGVIDEVLKMTGGATFVLATLCGVVVVELALCWVLAPFGVVWLAAAQTLALALLYAIQLAYGWRRHGVLLLPMLNPKRVGALVARLKRPS